MGGHPRSRYIKSTTYSLIGIFLPTITLAQSSVLFDNTGVGDAIENNTGLGNTSPTAATDIFITWFLGILGLLALIMIIWGGVQWMTSGGNEEKVQSAQATLRRATIGLLIIMGAYGLATYVFTQLSTATGTTASVSTSSGLGTTDPVIITETLIGVFLGILALIALIYIIYAGFTWMTSGGNEEKVSTAKSTLSRATIGLLIIMGAYGLTRYLFSTLSNATGTGLSIETTVESIESELL